jgi:hypothetical protein
MRIEAVDCGVRDTEEINAAIGAFAAHPNTGLIVLPDPVVLAHRGLIIKLAAKQRPAI